MIGLRDKTDKGLLEYQWTLSAESYAWTDWTAQKQKITRNATDVSISRHWETDRYRKSQFTRVYSIENPDLSVVHNENNALKKIVLRNVFRTLRDRSIPLLIVVVHHVAFKFSRKFRASSTAWIGHGDRNNGISWFRKKNDVFNNTLAFRVSTCSGHSHRNGGVCGTRALDPSVYFYQTSKRNRNGTTFTRKQKWQLRVLIIVDLLTMRRDEKRDPSAPPIVLPGI